MRDMTPGRGARRERRAIRGLTSRSRSRLSASQKPRRAEVIGSAVSILGRRACASHLQAIAAPIRSG